MGDQFAAFLQAIYCLYEEKRWPHLFYYRGNPDYQCITNPENKGEIIRTTKVNWDEEGRFVKFTFTRRCTDRTAILGDAPDPVEVEIDSVFGIDRYVVDGRDLCYAVAKGCTEAIKKYGLLGYTKSTSNQYYGDTINIKDLLFIKAYALDALEARETEQAWENPNGWEKAEKSSFEKEMELLLFDM